MIAYIYKTFAMWQELKMLYLKSKFYFSPITLWIKHYPHFIVLCHCDYEVH